jgi:hypothetical protein
MKNAMKTLEFKFERTIPALPGEVFDGWLNPRFPATPAADSIFIAKCQKQALLFLPCNRGIFHTGLLVPTVKTREVTGIPCRAESRSTQIPVWADFTRYGAQIVPKIDDRRTAPEPVTVIDAVNHEARLEHERMRDHRIMLGVGVLLDVEILLNRSVGVRKEGPLGSD